MRRDLELIRLIVLEVESQPTGYMMGDLQIEGYTKDQVSYHSYLIVDSGLAQGIEITSMDDTSPNWKILHLTSAGHDFAEAARNDSVWQKAVAFTTRNAGTAVMEVFRQVLVETVKQNAGL